MSRTKPFNLVPFDGNDNLRPFTYQREGVNYTDPKRASCDVIWKPSDATFEGTLVFLSGSKHNAPYFQDERGCEYPMLLRDLWELLSKGVIREGEVSGTWGFSRKRSEYGVRYLGPVGTRAHESRQPGVDGSRRVA